MASDVDGFADIEGEPKVEILFNSDILVGL